MADPDLEIVGGGAGEAEGIGLAKKFLPSFGPQFGSKSKGGRVPRAPSLDPPLTFLATPILRADVSKY